MDLFNTASAYANILVQAKLLAEREQKDDNAAHALNNRLHNNAFCGLLYEGADFEVLESESGRLIRIDFNNNSYVVPDKAVKNILRNDYDRIVGGKEAVSSINKEESHEDAETIAVEEKEPEAKKEAILEPVKAETLPEVAEAIAEPEEKMESVKEIPEEKAKEPETAIVKKEESAQTETSATEKKNPVPQNKTNPQAGKKKTPDAPVNKGIIVDEKAFSITSNLDHAVVSINDDGSMSFETRDEKKTVEKKPVEEKPVESTPLSAFTAFANGIENDLESEDEEEEVIARPVFQRKSVENSAPKAKNAVAETATIEEDTTVKHGFFRKKTDGNAVTPKPVLSSKPAHEVTRKGFFQKKDEPKSVEDSSDSNKEKESNKPTKSLFGFAPKKPTLNKEKEEVVPEEIVIPKLELFDDDEKQDHSNDRGKLFNHIHTIVLRRSFGAAEIGPYRFIIWPTWIYDRTTSTSFAEILVHVTDPNDKEYIFVTQKHENDINMTIDGKTFKVYGTWKSGMFTSHVVLTNKTASIYQPIEEIKKNVPDDFNNEFLDQFRLEKKGQPTLFITPFKSYNGGEEYIPITGYVELNGVRTVLPRRPKNELRYTFSGIERVVRGFWKEGTFDFTSDDANRLILFGKEGA